MKKVILFMLTILFVSCNASAQKTEKSKEVFPVSKTDAQWKSELTKM